MSVLNPILCMVLLLCGCGSQSKLDSGNFDDFLQSASRSQKHSGDFGAFFGAQVVRYGGHSASSSHPSEMRGEWYFESDHDGFAAQLYNAPFSQVQSFMEKVYGMPRDIQTNLYGSSSGLYGVREIGVAIQFFGDTNGVGFICLHKQK